MRYRTFTAAVIAGAAVVLVTATAASALTIHQRHGRPGRVSLPLMTGIHPVDELPTVAFASAGYIRRSPASSAAQTICIRYRIWSYDFSFGTWLLVASSPRECDHTPRGWSVRPNAYRDQFEPDNGYRGTALITWATRSKRLGSEVLDYAAQSDYACYGGCEIQQNSAGHAYIFFNF